MLKSRVCLSLLSQFSVCIADLDCFQQGSLFGCLMLFGKGSKGDINSRLVSRNRNKIIRKHFPVSKWASSQLKQKAKKTSTCSMICLLANFLVTLSGPKCEKLEIPYTGMKGLPIAEKWLLIYFSFCSVKSD